MGYQSALEAAGVIIKEFKEFGSYQGTWIAITSDNQVIEGSYGSCSGCDSFQSEFDYYDEPMIHEGKYYKSGNYWDSEEECSKEEYEQAIQESKNKLARFGEFYVRTSESLDSIIDRYKKKIDDEWAWEDDKEIYEWLVSKKN